MTKLFFSLLCIAFLAACAAAQTVKPPDLNRTDRSGDLGKQLNYLCLRQLGADCRERLAFGQPSYLKEPFTSSKRGQQMHETQVRPIASIAFAASTLVTFGSYDEKAAGFSRQEMARISVSLIRELAEHHIANTDKSSWWWGSEWQSAYWTGIAGQGAWMMWDHLSPTTRAQVAAMVAFEADRFLKIPAPHNEFSDTKAEENSWDSEVIVLAECMMPSHPHAAAWDEKAKEYMITSFARPEDLTSTKPIDGKPLKDWLVGPNVHSDFSLENHGFFHPDYESAYYLSVHNLPTYELAGTKPPESLFYNIAQLRDILIFLTLPNGWTFYPQCTDWGNYRNDVTIMAQCTNPVLPSAVGARCLRWGLDFINYADSSDAGKTSKNLFRGLNFNGCPLDTMTHVYLLHYLSGPGAEPLSDAQAREALAGTRLFEQGKVVVCRSRDAMASFSWFDSSRRLMACVTPMEQDCLALPKFRSLIGTVGGKIDDANITGQHVEMLKGGGFSVKLAMQRGPGLAVSEKVAMTALPDGRVVYAEWLAGVPDSVEVRTGLVFFENNPFWLHGARPMVYYPGGTWAQPIPAAGAKPAPTAPVVLSGETAQWLNVSGKFGIAVRGSRAVSIEDGQLVLNYRPAAGGEVSPCTVVVFYPNASRQATEQASRSLKVAGMGTDSLTVDLGDRRVMLRAEQTPG